MENEKNNGEIDIVAYIRVIVGSWRVILITTLLMLILVGAYYRLLPEQYEIKTVIQLSAINDQPIVNPLETVSKITGGVYPAVVFEKTNIVEMRRLPVEATIVDGTNLLTLSTKSSDLELGKKFLEELSMVIINEEQIVADRDKKAQNDKTDLLKDAIKRSEEKLALLREIINQKTERLRLLEGQLNFINQLGSKDLHEQLAFLNANLFLESSRQKITDYRFEQMLIEESLDKLKSQFIDLTTLNQEIIEARTINGFDNNRSLRPKFIVILIASIMMGLFLGSFCVLLVNWWKEVKNR